MSYCELSGFVVALAALWIAFSESRRNNAVVIDIIKCEAGRGDSLEEGQYLELSLAFRNLGIPLHEVRVSLEYVMPDGWSTLEVELFSPENPATQIAKGTIFPFNVKSNKSPEHILSSFAGLSDPGSQQARLVVSCQGFKAWQKRVGGIGDRMKLLWNKIAGFLTFRFAKKTSTPEGRPGLDILHVPMFVVPGTAFAWFGKAIRDGAISKLPQGPRS